MRRIFLMVAFAMLFPVQGWPQAQADPAESTADAAYQAQKWTEAEQAYAALTKQSPDNARFWYRYAVSARADKHYDVALEAMQKAKSLGSGHGLPPFVADYEIATIYAGMGDRSHALQTLKAAADGGYFQSSRLNNDTEWNSLRADEQFVAAAKEVHHNAAPCEDPEFKQFDFWVGDWDVSSAKDGVQRGTSHVAKEMGGCVVWENWTSAGSPYFGKSYNTYNLNLKRWEQYWVDNTAGVMFFHGALKDNIMDYWTDDVPQNAGGTLLRHLQFFNLGKDKIRQFSQGSNDGGKTWHVEYDLIYTRRASKAAAVPGS